MSKVIFLLFCSGLLLQGAFFKIRIGEVTVDEKSQPLLASELEIQQWRLGWSSALPRTRFEKFAFVIPDFDFSAEDWVERSFRARSEGRVSGAWLIFEMEEAAKQQGFLDVWDQEKLEWVSMAAEVKAADLTRLDDEEAEEMRAWHDRHLLVSGARGGLWYRGRSGTGERDVPGFNANRSRSDFDQTFTTLGGGQALAENLALDRDLILGRGKEETTVPLSEIKGVTVTPIPWEERMPEGEIAVDRLSKRVPEDQHLFLVPSLDELFDLMKGLENTATPVLESYGASSEYRELPSRYKSQMGLDLPESLARFLPVEKVAVTGGDPFFPTGSDLALIFETGKVDFVFSALKKTIATKAKLAGATAVKQAEGVGYKNADRSFSSYLTKLDGAVVISNSSHQIARLRAVADGKVPSLGATDEYRFFRHRYPADQSESAYLFISDACLRRWSGPEVRIGASRRNRALSALAKVTAVHLKTGELDRSYADLLGKVSLEGGLVMSENYGSFEFLTPIGELGIEQVTGLERDGYDRWRRGYENGWARFFDPIAIQLELREDRKEVDMTILPLRVDTDYEEMISLTGDATLTEGSRTVPEKSVFHFAMAIDKESDLFKEGAMSLVNLLPSLSVNPLGWMGQAVSVTLGESEAWESDLGMDSLPNLPVLLRVEVESRLKLAFFMTAVKGAIESSGPDLVRWETRTHGEWKYVAMIGDEEEIGTEVSLYYATLPSALLVSLSEEMLKEAMDREAKLKNGGEATGQVMVQTTPDFVTTMGGKLGDAGLSKRRRLESYQALPILNEWYQTRGAEDPVAYHEEHFGETLTCPGRMGYRWNAADLTMESVAFGHPGRPLDNAGPQDLYGRFQMISMDASFEDGGLRMKVSLGATGAEGEAEEAE